MLDARIVMAVGAGAAAQAAATPVAPPSVVEWVDAIASGVTAVAALGALAYAHWQIRAAREADAENRHLAREMDALNAYERYHELLLRYPHFAKGFKAKKAEAQERTRYEIFVLGLMLTIERVLVLLPDDANWEPALADDVTMHKDFLCSKSWAKDCLPLVSPVVAEFIKKIADKASWRYPWRG